MTQCGLGKWHVVPRQRETPRAHPRMPLEVRAGTTVLVATGGLLNFLSKTTIALAVVQRKDLKKQGERENEGKNSR